MSVAWFDSLAQMATGWAVSLVGGLVLVAVGFMAAHLTRKGLRGALGHTRLDAQIVWLVTGLSYYLVVAVVLIAAFGVMGIETASLITILGACSLAIGLALQGSLSNFASGTMLLVFRPFRLGELIETGDYLGYVAEAGLFSTKIDTLENIRVDIPNTYITQRPLKNWSANSAQRLDFSIEVAIECDLPMVKGSIAEALAADERLLREPETVIGIENFGDSSAQLVIRPWCKPEDYWTLKFSLPEAIKTAVEAAGGAMPTPRRDIQLVGGAIE